MAFETGRMRRQNHDRSILTWKKHITSLALWARLNHIAGKISGERGLGRRVIRQFWLHSAKGGDPMSHGSARGSVSFRTEHYRR
ncbi:hypothetical protein GRI44_06955 [Altererythrobacter confluentis]|uniref:Uncharacterized protein n=1 Tax=Allopontixanthobacter confluentis TaxID=1849021 RepID=A0A6L7GHU1_9SPHN|nr:hypothetical protein [Allopontixanthobacter confluentis]MXP14488.1 hypothetical protein [Allopontixanthobacter confluentis]